MPPKKKAKQSSSNEPEDPADFFPHIRNESGKRFSTTNRNKGEHNSDIEQNVREIRALLKINAEIFGRCMESVVEVKDHLTFTRSDFSKVTVRPSYSHEDMTELITVQERTKKSFSMKPLSELPIGLKDLFELKYKPIRYKLSSPNIDSFIDYDAFFKTAIMLHDDVLEPFLVRLKQHLDLIQVCLGETESWLREPKNNIQFLEETFRTKLAIFTNDELVLFEEGDDCIEQVLKSYYCESGRFETTFTIAQASDQQKLRNFLVFMGK